MGDRQRLLNLEDVRGVLGDMFEEITVSGYEWLDVWDQFWTLQGFCQEELHKRLIGQDDAVRVLAQASLECVETSEAADFEILLWTVRRFQLISGPHTTEDSTISIWTCRSKQTYRFMPVLRTHRSW